MVQTTSPDNINKWTNGDPTSIVQASQSQGDSVQAAFNKRQRFDYVWPTSAERTAQTGMAQGSRGYQVDTKTEYIYDNSAWRLSTPYAEYTSSNASVPNSTFTQFTSLTFQSAISTSSTFTSTTGTGFITLADPGIYSISIYSIFLVGLPAGSFVMISSDAAFTNQLSRGQFAGDGRTTTVLPFYRTTSANSTLYFFYFQTSGSAQSATSTIRIGRFS